LRELFQIKPTRISPLHVRTKQDNIVNVSSSRRRRPFSVRLHKPSIRTRVDRWVNSDYVSERAGVRQPNAQYTPPTPMRLNCRVAPRRGVNAPVGSRDPVYTFLCCWAAEVGDKWRRNDIIVEKIINIDQSSRSQTAVCSVSKLSTKSVGSRRELVANCVHTADADATQLDIFKRRKVKVERTRSNALK